MDPGGGGGGGGVPTTFSGWFFYCCLSVYENSHGPGPYPPPPFEEFWPRTPPLSRTTWHRPYPVMIFDFATKYEWQSLLDFDVRYREQQAEHSFRWGTSAIQLESLLLTSRCKSSGQTRVIPCQINQWQKS